MLPGYSIRRQPTASVNFVTCHDGFTLNDLVSYDEKRNAANQENNQDGTNDNRSWNCGSSPGDDGPTADPDIATLRRRQQRNLLATLFLSPRACPCSWPGTSGIAPNRATTMPTARTTRSAGSTGRPIRPPML